jgi:arylsulfatase A-like enzyme
MSIFTSSYPIVHHIVNTIVLHTVNTRSKLSEGRVTLAEVLGRNGYTTGACISAPTMLPAYLGFSRGFDLYDDHTVSVDVDLNSSQLDTLYGGQNDHPISPLTHGMVINWLEANYNRKFFLFAHYWDVHGDYAPPAPYNTMFDPDYKGKFNGRLGYIIKIQPGIAEEDLNHMIALYDGEIRYVDSYIGMLLAKLEELNLTNNTLIILTADHGEEFLEHGSNMHGKTLYDEVIHVPLIIKYPPLIPAGRTISEVVSTISIMPTILDILGIPLKEEVQGKSLLPLITGKGNYDGREVYSETEMYIPLKSVRTQEFKFIYNMETQEEELYNLKSDPGEQTNLIDQDIASARLFERKLFNWIIASSQLGSSSEASGSTQLDEEAKERLRALGYLH